jgi:hypothetical protein
MEALREWLALRRQLPFYDALIQVLSLCAMSDTHPFPLRSVLPPSMICGIWRMQTSNSSGLASSCGACGLKSPSYVRPPLVSPLVSPLCRSCVALSPSCVAASPSSVLFGAAYAEGAYQGLSERVTSHLGGTDRTLSTLVGALPYLLVRVVVPSAYSLSIEWTSHVSPWWDGPKSFALVCSLGSSYFSARWVLPFFLLSLRDCCESYPALIP